jgi:periplasmic protein TonB
MNEPTSAVLIERARLDPGAGRHLAWSVLGHLVVGAAIVLWPRAEVDPALRQVMRINLAGAPGPRTGGMTQMGGAPEAPVAPEPARPAPPPPAQTTKPAVPTPPRTPAATPTSTSRRPPAAKEPTAGDTPVDTGAKQRGFGLSNSGSAGAGRRVELDVSNFCCPEYIERVVLVIERAWDRNQGVRGAAIVSFTIRRDGTLDAVAVRQSSGHYALDNAALRAVARAQQVPPLPAEFPGPSLTLRVTFEYQ